MIIYIIYILVFLIFLFITFISINALIRGINAKKKNKLK